MLEAKSKKEDKNCRERKAKEKNEKKGTVKEIQDYL
jgi:hypothetical protein